MALCLERSVELLVAILGILKAGGAYVPLDPLQPERRLRLVVEDARAPIVVTQEKLRGKFAAMDVVAVCLDTDWPQIATRSAEKAEIELFPENLAYIIYTSGSTGRPKGVMIRHESLSSLGEALEQALGCGTELRRVGVNAPVVFDASVKQLLQLSRGHTLHIVPDQVRGDGQELRSYLGEHRLDLFDCTPSQLRLILDSASDLADLAQTLFLIGGEPVDKSLWNRLSIPGSPPAFNVYGPTECTVDVTVCRIQPELMEPAIGRPLANVEVYVLDENLRPVPIGIPGQLAVGGRGLARGYLSSPELTAERFLPHPFSPGVGERLYKTGDLVRHLSHGGIEFLGRIDQQVKVRGYRVELGEIESVLTNHPGVQMGAVLLAQLAPEDRRLVAYWVAVRGQAPAPDELREHMRRQLPEYMVPGLFVQLPGLPLTRNGKVDRHALPAPVLQQQERHFVAPRTQTEQMLAEIWGEVLKLERVGVEDDFFDLGGHSLLATQLISRVRKVFRIDLPLRALFEAPQLDHLAGRIEESIRSGATLQAPPIEPIARDGELPLSFAQQRLWFLDQLQPGNPFYNVPFVVRLAGRLEVRALERTLSEVVRRHEVLRTCFPSQGGEPVQRIQAAEAWRIPLIDLSGLPAAVRKAEERLHASAEAKRAFDLARGPLLRMNLLRLGEEDHTAIFLQHHIVSDAWSTGLLLREVTSLYGAFKGGSMSPLPELDVQYADFARWQRQWLQGETIAEQLAYWTRQLADAPPRLELPTDFPRPAMPSFRGATERFELAEDLTVALRRLSRGEGATLFMTLLAAFQILLSRYAGQQDVSVGTPIAGRNRLETENLIGFFVNTLVLRSNLAGDPAFRDFLVRVREVALEAHAHQDLPFERLVEELQPERSLSHMPLFQVSFTLLNARRETFRLEGLEILGEETGSETAKFDLNLSMAESEERLYGRFEYSTDLFRGSSIRLMIEHLQKLLGSITVEPGARIGSLSLLTESERRQLLVERNATRAEYPRDRCVHQLFEARVDMCGEATAVSAGDRHLSYLELDRRANRLTSFLRARGTRPGIRVGLYLGNSLETIVAILGVLKAGAAYVPLDPAHPVQQTGFMLRDSEVLLLLTQQRWLDRLAASGIESFCLDTEWERIEQESPEKLTVDVQPESPAYVIYTSGSTGQPKGVEIPHRALTNYAWWASEVYVRGEEVAFPLYSSLSFDLTVTSVYAPLITGNRIVVCGGTSYESTVREILRDGQVDVLKLTPSHLALIKDLDNRGSRVRRLIVGGEALTTELARRILESFGGEVEILNEYGPTEATVGCMLHRFDLLRDRRSSVPIGGPGANVYVYILDESLCPVAGNVTGELYIAGDGLAHRYLNREELTAERFVDNPFIIGEKMYRSGDLARWLPEGGIEFVGRRDQQVKFHGYRIELDGIRCALNEHPLVRDSVVTIRRDEAGQELLVAFYVARQALRAEELRSFLAEHLIAETVPNLFVYLRRLPLTLNGKVNYAALPSIQEARSHLERTFIMPSTPSEEVLAGIWARVLGLEKIGSTENFFGLGGHSLLATQIASRAQEAFGIELPLRSIFEEPTIAGLARKIESLMRQGRARETPRIEPVPRGLPLSLSFAQQRLWFLQQFEPGSASYNLRIGVRLQGKLDVRALGSSFNEIVRRHEVLRTTFPTVDGEPRQVIAPAAPLAVPLIDLTQSGGAEAEARRIAGLEGQRPFELSRSPALRCQLLRLTSEDHVVLVTMHHIVSDAGSMGIMVRELMTLYEAFRTGAQSPLPEPLVQYADFAVWQRHWLVRETLEGELEYWRDRLRGLPPLLQLPIDRPRPAVQTTTGAVHAFLLPKDLTESLRRLALQEGATLFMASAALFQALLGRMAGREDICVGVPVSGRDRLEVEGLIGFFVNVLVLRGDLAGDPSFPEWLKRVRTDILEVYSHRNLPFEKLVEELVPERNLAYSPLFQVMLTFQNNPIEGVEAFRLPDLAVTPFGVARSTAKFDLTLSLVLTAGGLSGVWEYNRDLFDAATIIRTAGHFQTLAAEAVASPTKSLSQLAILTRAERHQVYMEWSGGCDEWPRVRTDELFEAQVRRRPAAAAVVWEQESWSYRELDTRAEKWARFLRGVGVGPEVRVGLCTQRSPCLITGMLGILKAGGAFVPLDPAHPRERLEMLLKDSGAAMVLTQRHLAGAFSAADLPIHLLDVDPEVPDGAILAPGAPVDSLAYVIYTSGSTGKPKGVMVSHASLSPMLLWSRGYLGLSERTRVLQNLSFGFDFGIFELLTTLVSGATLYIPGEDDRGDPARWAALVREHGINTVHTTPSFFREVMKTGIRLEELEVLHLGGETLYRGDVKSLTEVTGEACALYNGYGPTEATINSLIFKIDKEGTEGLSVPIGRPSANNLAYVLDREGEPAPIGIPGELYVGGGGVARGYLERPRLTAERFIPDRWGAEAGGRLYRTGDLVRWLPGGNIEFLGRTDDQVKVRGVRIEPGEIEAVLTAHSQVRQALVTVREDAVKGSQLVAYVVVTEGQDMSGRLREWLRQQLPYYMVPAAFVILSELKLTASGKIDRRALPEPVQDAAEGGSSPRNAIEEAVVSIWDEVLHRDQIGIRDNFFALGGHSLLATRVMSRVRHTFGIELPLRNLFEAPTVVELAQRIRHEMGRTPRLQAPSLVPGALAERTGPAPLSFSQQRLWFLHQLDPRSTAENLVLAVRLAGRLDAAALDGAMSEMVCRHESLRTVFWVADGEPVQVVQPAQDFVFPSVDLSGLGGLAEPTARRLALEQAGQPFDLARGPLFRPLLLRLRAEDHLVLMMMHHIICDGWSMGILARELGALYRAFHEGQPPALPALAVQYPDYARWQRQWLTGDALESALAYWRGQLEGVPALLQLPTDRPRPEIQSFRGDARVFVLEEDLTEGLRTLAQEERATLFMVLLAGFQVLLARLSGQEDLAVGTPIAGRDHLEIEGLIGFFVNTLVLRAELSADPSYVDFLSRTRSRALDAYAQQELPFEKLVEELAVERSLMHSPLFQAMFVLQNTPASSLDLPGLSWTSIPTEETTARFDLVLSLSQQANRLNGALRYNTDIFDATTAQRMVEHFQALLGAVMADRRQPVWALPLLTSEQRHQLLLEWNDTRARDRDIPLLRLLEAPLEERPGSLAVVCGEEELTYADLHRRAGRLARRLCRLGAGPDVVVGLHLDRSPGMVVAILAVLKAGGAYLPLDPLQPAQRLTSILAEAGVQVLLTQRGLAAGLPSFKGEVVLLDDKELDDKEKDEINPAAGQDRDRTGTALPENLAYLIYTSGSTGGAKGVAVTRRGLVNLIQASAACHGQVGSLLLLSSFSFDMSVVSLFWTLGQGGTLVLPVPSPVVDLPMIHRLIVERQVSHLICIPSLYSILIEMSAPGALASLHSVRVAGEICPTGLVASHRRALPHADLFNEYGPTEGTVWSSVHRADVAQPELQIPIGRPIANTRIYLLDRRLRPVPLGSSGEMFLGGMGLVRGYHRRPGLTAETFIPNPWAEEPGERLYRTGDVARFRADGEIDFLGRVDQQLKIRGFRVEPGEIETALLTHPSVRNAAVIAYHNGRGGLALAAYLELKASHEVAIDELRGFLRASLPEPMIPPSFRILDSLPLTTAGKIDRRTLAKISKAQEETEYAAPSTDLEQEIAAIWKEMLGVARVGTNDNFFDLGGHSLLLVRLQRRLLDRFGREISMIDLFRFPTVASLARRLVSGGQAETSFQDEGERSAARRSAVRRSGQRRQEARAAEERLEERT